MYIGKVNFLNLRNFTNMIIINYKIYCLLDTDVVIDTTKTKHSDKIVQRAVSNCVKNSSKEIWREYILTE